MKKDNTNFSSAFEKIFGHYCEHINHNDYLYIQRIFKNGIEKYVNRLKALGFVGNDRVLDAGCGFGQWSLALSTLNKTVTSCDISSIRINFLNDMMHGCDIDNIQIDKSSLNELPYSDNTFDAIFCYSVIFLTPWKESLHELARVLKPNGKLYISANEVGWYIFLWDKEHNKADNYDPKLVASKAFSDTILYNREGIFRQGMNIIIDLEQIREEFDRLGFVNIQASNEGGLHLNPSVDKPQPFFYGDHNGKPNVYELIGTKQVGR
ncbi:class I SAM-dependent methyltransferase [Candidatus Woesearchaeota archaeon]|nr:class I SAM-dependent methyltransferase [Candidatus Woesearchaeota archaeon]MBT4764644.1 class I SAM-dependent methyltransferase [bacterium]MBT7556911.1 class I SAM-dependent methyltransferase [Candidatus Woesearchaeota archaeon]